MSSLNILSDHLSESELADQLRKKPSTIERWRRKRIGPPVTYNGKTPIYWIPGVQAWLKAQERQPVRSARIRRPSRRSI